MGQEVIRRQQLAWGILLGILLLGSYLRLASIGMLEPHVDESGNLLTSIDPYFREMVSPGELCRPLLAWLYRMVPNFAAVLGTDLLTAARIQGALAGIVTAVVLGVVMWREASPVAGIFVISFWLLTPLTIIHERLILQDQYSALFFAFGCLLISVAGINRSRLGEFTLFLLFGAFIGLAVGNKVTALCDLPWMFGFGLTVWQRHGRPLNPSRILVPSMLGFSIITLLLGWKSLDQISFRLQHQSYHLPDITVSNLFGSLLLLPGALVAVAGTAGLLYFLSGIASSWDRADHWRMLFGGLLGSVVLYGIAYSQTYYLRYALPLFVPVVILASVGYSRWWNPQDDGKRARFLTKTASLFLAVYWIFGIQGLISNPLMNRWSPAEIRDRDYQQYTISGYAGYGLSELGDSIRAINQYPTYIVPGGWDTVFNGLYLKCFESRSCSVRRLGERQNDADFVIDSWRRSKREGEMLFIVGRDRCTLVEDKEQCVRSSLRDRPGVDLEERVRIPGPNDGLIIRASEVVSTVPTTLEMEFQEPFSDGFLSPRTVIPLGADFDGANSIRLRGEVPPAISRIGVTAFIDNHEAKTASIVGRIVTLDIPLRPRQKADKRLLHLAFDDWEAIPDPLSLVDGYWGGYRAVSLRLLSIKPLTEFDNLSH